MLFQQFLDFTIFLGFQSHECSENSSVGFVANLIQQWNEKSSETFDIAVLKVDSGRASAELNPLENDLIKEMAKTSPVVIVNASENYSGENLHGPDFLIIISDVYEQVRTKNDSSGFSVDLYFPIFQNLIVEAFQKCCFYTKIWNSKAKFIFVPVYSLIRNIDVTRLHFLMHTFGKTDFTVVFNIESSLFFSQFDKSSASVNYFDTREVNEIDSVFPEKHKKFTGKVFRLVVFYQYPDFYFLQTVVHHEKAGIGSIPIMSANIASTPAILSEYLTSHKIDIVLNTGIEFDGPVRKMSTYDMKEFCAMIPKVHTKLLTQLLFMGLDGKICNVFLICIGISCILWKFVNQRKLVKSLNGVGDFLFAIYALFVGQYLTLPRISLAQKYLIGNFVFLTMIIITIYQPNSISFLINGDDIHLVSSIKELEESGLNVIVDPVVYKSFNSSIFHRKLFGKMQSSSVEYSSNDSQFSNRTALILECEQLKYVQRNFEKYQNFYIMKEKLFSSYNYYTVGYFSMIFDRMNWYSLTIFESGIRKHWEKVLPPSDKIIQNHQNFFNENSEVSALKLSDLKNVFYVWLAGIGFSTIVFIGELLFAKIFGKKEIHYFESKFFGKHLNFLEVLILERRKSETDLNMNGFGRLGIENFRNGRRKSAPIIRKFEGAEEFQNVSVVYL